MYRIKATPKVLTSNNPIEDFLQNIDVTEESRDTYRRQLRQYSDWLDKKEILNPDRNSIIEYREHLINSGLSQTTVKAYLLAVQHLYGWLEEKGLSVNIARNIRLPKSPIGFRKDSLTIEQARNLLSVFDRTTVQGARDYAIVNVLLRCGLREIEIVRANIGDIQNHNGQAVLYVQGKGMQTKEEYVLLTESCLTAISHYLAMRGTNNNNSPLLAACSKNNPEGRLSTRSVSRIVKQALRKIGLDSPRLTSHSCRHFSLTTARQAGCEYDEIRSFARHRHLSVTISYCHNVDRMNVNAPEFKIEEALGKVA